jgi:hypothetical protein
MDLPHLGRKDISAGWALRHRNVVFADPALLYGEHPHSRIHHLVSEDFEASLWTVHRDYCAAEPAGLDRTGFFRRQTFADLLRVV